MPIHISSVNGMQQGCLLQTEHTAVLEFNLEELWHIRFLLKSVLLHVSISTTNMDNICYHEI